MVNPRGVRAGGAYIELSTSNKMAAGLNKASQQLRRFAGSMDAVGNKLVRMGAVMAVPFSIGVKSAATFEEQMAKVSTMLDDTEMLDKFSASLKQMAVESGESTATLAKGLYDILSAGTKAEHAIDFLNVSVRAAKAGFVDTAISADAITTVLNAYGMSADRAAGVSDMLFTTVRRGKTTMEELAPAIGNIAGLASSAGVDIDELGASIALLTRNGIRTDMAVTSLGAVINTFLKKPSQEAVPILRKLNFEMNATTLKTEGLHGVFKKLEGLSTEDLAKLFPNVRALKGVLPAMKHIAEFGNDIDAMGDKAGATEDAYKKMTSTLAHQFRQLRQSVTTAFVAIGEAIIEPSKKYVKMVRDVIRLSTAWIIDNKRLVATLSGIPTILLGVGVALKLTAVGVGMLAGTFSALATAVGTVATVAGMLLTPLGAVAGVVAGLVVAFVDWRNVAASTLDFLTEKFKTLGRVGTDAWGAITDAINSGDMSLAMDTVVAAMKYGFAEIRFFALKNWLDIKYNFIDYMADIVDNIGGKFSKLWDFLSGGFLKIVDYVTDLFSGLGNMIVQSLTSAVTGGEIEKSFTILFMNISGFSDAEIADAMREIDRQSAQKRQQSGGSKSIFNSLIATPAERTSRREGLSAEIDAARAEWDKAKQAASDALATAEISKKESEKQKSIAKDMADLNKYLAKKTSSDITAGGTFSAAAIAGIQSQSNVQERTARATEKTSKLIAALIDYQKSTFGTVLLK